MKSVISRNSILFVALFTAVFLATFAARYIAKGQTVAGAGGITTFDGVYVVSPDEALPCTTSSSFEDLAGASQNFFQAGNSQQVVVLFQGQWIANGGLSDRVRVRLMIDNVPQSNAVGTISTAFLNETNGMNFISDPLLSGQHEAKIQWQSASGTEVCVRARSLIVLHR